MNIIERLKVLSGIHKEPLYQEASLRSKRTGLPFYVWVSTNEKVKHSIRLKIAPSFKYKENELIIIGLKPDIKVIHGDMSKKNFDLLVRWANLNMVVIEDYWNRNIDTEDVYERIRAI